MELARHAIMGGSLRETQRLFNRPSYHFVHCFITNDQGCYPDHLHYQRISRRNLTIFTLFIFFVELLLLNFFDVGDGQRYGKSPAVVFLSYKDCSQD